MRKLILGISPALIALGYSVPAQAQEPAWHVSQVSGNVRIVENGRTRAATRGALLASGAAITTAEDGRAVLVRGRDYVVVSPRSQLRVPDPQAQSRGFIQMLSDWGTALFRIEHRANPHFGVQTPYLAAVVKGTVFTVNTGPSGASVQVTEGAVEVSTVDGGAADMVRPGMIASVSSSDLHQLTVDAETSRVIRSDGHAAPGVVTVPAPAQGAYSGPAGESAAVSHPVPEAPVSFADSTNGLVGDVAGDRPGANVADEQRADPATGQAGNPGQSGGEGAAGSGNAGGGDHGGADRAPGGPSDVGGGASDHGGAGNGGGTGNGGNGGAGNGDAGNGNDGGAGNGGNGGTGNGDAGNGGNGGTGNGDAGNGGNGGTGNGDAGNGNDGGAGNGGNGDAGNGGSGNGDDGDASGGNGGAGGADDGDAGDDHGGSDGRDNGASSGDDGDGTDNGRDDRGGNDGHGGNDGRGGGHDFDPE